ncbi:FUSC family protein [Acetobacteraceae bacterium KSS8]|uniref:FUSC family protein n=1 Tax=Endosaccharibacter trunci TaxID=2812733 RepID=A0ABT1W563_9PROT|nr:FUSC family protein [Acetobacteraceae bacterium KSS8]
MSGIVASRPALVRAAWDGLRAEQANLLFVARTLLAASIALFVAFFLQLQSPLSAVTTVLIVVAPTNGAVLSKSFWRLVGTLIGAAAAVALMAVFAQSPLLYTLVLSCCIAVACFVSTLLRFFKAYSAVLAGYTIIIVSAGAFNAPDDIFIDALSRVSAVSTGLASAALVFLVTVLPRSSALADGIDRILRDLAALFLRMRYAAGGDASESRARAALLARIAALDEAIEYGAAESSALRRRRHAMRLAASRLLGLLSAVEPIHGDAAASAVGMAARRIAHRCMALVADRSVGLGSLASETAAAGHALNALADRAPSASALLVSMHERRLVSDLHRTVAALGAAGDGRSGLEATERRVRLRPLPEWHAAGRNAARGFLVTLIAGLFWYVSQWPSGPSLLAYLIPAACLLATNPSASRASVQFAIGTLMAVPMALFCQSILLPQIDGFPLLAFSLCLCLAPAIWLQTQARTRLAATGYAIFFCAMINVHNPIGFNDITLLNGLFSFILGPVLLVLVFRVLLPADVSGDARRFGGSLTRAVERFARRDLPGRGTPAMRFEVWQDLQMQKMLRLEQRAAQLPAGVGPRTTRAAYLVLTLGRTVAALRVLRRHPDLPADAREALDRGLAAIGRLSRSPLASAGAVSAAANALAMPAVPEDDGAGVEIGSDPLLPEADSGAASAEANAAHGTSNPGRSAPPIASLSSSAAAEDAANRIRREAHGLLDEAALLIRHAHGLLRRGCPIMQPDWRSELPDATGAESC